MNQKPKYYRLRERSRSGIAEHIAELTQPYYDRWDTWRLCFDVKLYAYDLSFDNLAKRFREDGSGHLPLETWTDEEWLAEARRRCDAHEDHLFHWGLEDIRSYFVGCGRDGEPDADCFTHSYAGKKLDVRYEFVGRSGGYLAITRFAGVEFAGRGGMSPLHDILHDMAFRDLRELYQLVVMLHHDTREEARNEALECAAAFTFFVNICNDIPLAAPKGLGDAPLPPIRIRQLTIRESEVT